MQFLRPDLYLSVLDHATADFKDSARLFLDRADAVLLRASGQELTPQWKEVSLRLIAGKPRFLVTPPDLIGDDLVAFVEQRLTPEPWSRNANLCQVEQPDNSPGRSHISADSIRDDSLQKPQKVVILRGCDFFELLMFFAPDRMFVQFPSAKPSSCLPRRAVRARCLADLSHKSAHYGAGQTTPAMLVDRCSRLSPQSTWEPKKGTASQDDDFVGVLNRYSGVPCAT